MGLIPHFLWEPAGKSAPLYGMCKTSLDVSKREAELFYGCQALSVLIISFSF